MTTKLIKIRSLTFNSKISETAMLPTANRQGNEEEKCID